MAGHYVRVEHACMSGLRLIGIILIVMGAIALAYEGFSYNRNKEVLRIGDASITATTKEKVRIPPWAGFAMIGGGVILLIIPRRSVRS